MLSLVVAIRASDVVATRDRFLLLAFSALWGMASALNSEYFRARLFHPENRSTISKIKGTMIRGNIIVTFFLAAALIVGGWLSIYLIPARYGAIGAPLATVALAVPLLFTSSMLFNIELARNRMAIAIGRNIAAAAVSLVGILAVYPGPYELIGVLIASEGSGFAVVGVAACKDYFRSRKGTKGLGRRPRA